VRAFGEDGQQQLQALTVAVVGASGIGSHVCEQLIRLGVGNILVVDPDVVELINLNRIVTAFAEDAHVQRSKVAAVESYSQRVGGPSKITPIKRNVLEIDVAEAIGRVDAIFGCTDTIASRAILNRIAVQHFIPYWDCGTEISTGGSDLRAFGRVRLVLAGGPCLVCMDVIDPAQLRIELLPADERDRERQLGYIRGQEVVAPAVVSLNAVAASLAVMSFLRWAVGEVTVEPGQWVYRAFAGDVRMQAAARRPDCPVCSEASRLGRPNASMAL
jgi:molybdopterin/thiamine biosynthesis adenylyltransferase